MTPELPQPFGQEDIRQDPKAVVIALLIGLLLLFGSVIGVLYYRKEEQDNKCTEKTDKLYEAMIRVRNERITFYEQMIFYKQENEILKRRDSLTKGKTLPYVEKILE